MNKKKTVGIPVAIITIIAGVAGGSYAFDFSQTNTTIGDITTNIVNEAMSNQELRDIGTDIALDILCDRTPEDPICEGRE